MINKFVFLLTVLLIATNHLSAQTTLNAGSHSSMLNNEYYEYAIGEMTLVSTIRSPQFVLTQGLLQPRLIVEPGASQVNVGGEGIQEQLKVYPNPTENILFIEMLTDEPSLISYQLYDAAGRMIINTEEQQVQGVNKYRVDVSAFAAGAYFLMIKKHRGDEVPVTFTYQIRKVQ